LEHRGKDGESPVEKTDDGTKHEDCHPDGNDNDNPGDKLVADGFG